MNNQKSIETKHQALLDDIIELIKKTKTMISQEVNSALVQLYWKVGHRVNQENLGEVRGVYGKKTVDDLVLKLTQEYGRGFARPNLFRMIAFSKDFPDFEIVSTLSRQLSWSHFVEILSLKEPLKKQFYAEMCRLERWSVRALRKKIQGMFFERTALSKNSDEFIKNELDHLSKEDRLTPSMVFRDPYFLDFLGLPDFFSESTLENAILLELTNFIQEFGSDFCFLARQKRITIDGDDFYIDLLFFHRSLRRLIAIELKLGKFSAGHKGQMELYLRWLDKYEKKDGEESPLGIILCSEKSHERIELLEMSKSGIHVAEYLTQLPSKTLLENKLHQAIANAKEKITCQELIILNNNDCKNKE